MLPIIRTLVVIIATSSVVYTRPYDADLVMNDRELKGILKKISHKTKGYKKRNGLNCIDCFPNDENDVLPKSSKMAEALIGQKFFTDLDYLPAYRSEVVVKTSDEFLKKKKTKNHKSTKEKAKKASEKKEKRKGKKGKGGKRKDQKGRKDKRGRKRAEYESSTDIMGLGALSNMRKFFGDIRTHFQPDDEMGNEILQNDAPVPTLEEPQFHLRDLETDSLPSYEALRVPESPTVSRRKFEPRFTKIKNLKYDPSFLWAGLG